MDKNLAGSFGDDYPEDDIGNKTGDAAWDEQQEEQQAEPKNGDTEEFTQPAAHTCDNPVMS